jgi:hypothetical protein
MASRQSERQTAATARPQDTVEESAGVAYRSQAAIAQSDELRQLLQQDDTAKSGAQGTGEAVQLRADEGASESEAEADGTPRPGCPRGSSTASRASLPSSKAPRQATSSMYP